MFTKSTLIAGLAVATISIASPAFAQSFSKTWGTGNSLPTYYDHNGALQIGIVPQQSNSQIATRRSGVNALAQSRTPLRATAQELNESRHGDYYAPRKTVAKQTTAQEQSALREGDFYAPTID